MESFCSSRTWEYSHWNVVAYISTKVWKVIRLGGDQNQKKKWKSDKARETGTWALIKQRHSPLSHRSAFCIAFRRHSLTRCRAYDTMSCHSLVIYFSSLIQMFGSNFSFIRISSLDFVVKKRDLRKEFPVTDLLGFSTNSSSSGQTTLDIAKNRLVHRAKHANVARSSTC